MSNDARYDYVRRGDVDVTGDGKPGTMHCVWRNDEGVLHIGQKGSQEAAEAQCAALLNTGFYAQIPG